MPGRQFHSIVGIEMADAVEGSMVKAGFKVKRSPVTREEAKKTYWMELGLHIGRDLIKVTGTKSKN